VAKSATFLRKDDCDRHYNETVLGIPLLLDTSKPVALRAS
jgi:hypothetical protein